MIYVDGGSAVRRRDRRWRYVILGVFIMMGLFTFLAHKAQDENVEAANLTAFDPGYIISDWQMSNYGSMSEWDIQSWLTAKNPCDNRDYDYYVRLSANTKYTWHFENGHFICLSEERFGNNDNEIGFQYGESAAHIIWQAAQDYRINPRVLLVLLQKETGLITDRIPNNGDYRKATGYGCPDTAECSSKYYGFKNQIRNAAYLFRYVLDNGSRYYPVGENYVQYNPNAGCGGTMVNIRNRATSSLYQYTPYQPNASALAAGYGTGDSCASYGNRNFYAYFEDWFGGVTSEGSIMAPRNVRARQNGSSVTLYWDEPDNARALGVERYEVVLANSDKQEIKVELGGSEHQYTFVDLPDGVYFAASVKAVSKGSEAYSRITFSYAVGRAPSEPINLVAIRKNGGIEISWDAPLDSGGLQINKYLVVLADKNKREYVKEVGSDCRSVIFYGLGMNEFFAASVKAFNAVGDKYSRITFLIKTYAEFNENNVLYDGFLDMPSDEISKKAISWAAYNGITDKNLYFNGDSALTRRQAMVVLWRMAGKPEVSIYDGFLDMPSDEISKKAISWAAYNGITDKNLYFNGDSALTRRQAMVVLWRMAGKPEVSIYDGFLDMPSDEISKKAISWAAYNGITDKNLYFNGDSALTRRQAMVVSFRTWKVVVSVGGG